MPSTPTDTAIDPEIVSLARRYRRLERLLSVVLAIVAIIAIVATVVLLPFLSALIFVILILLFLRIPLFTVDGSMEMETTAAPEAVQRDFESTTPPVLAFQWAIADDIQSTRDGCVYEFSYLFGLRSITMETEITSDPDRRSVKLSSRSAGRAWGIYTVSITERSGITTIEIELASDRRFELARLTQLAAAAYYQRQVLETQGYTPLSRARSVRPQFR